MKTLEEYQEQLVREGHLVAMKQVELEEAYAIAADIQICCHAVGLEGSIDINLGGWVTAGSGNITVYSDIQLFFHDKESWADVIPLIEHLEVAGIAASDSWTSMDVPASFCRKFEYVRKPMCEISIFWSLKEQNTSGCTRRLVRIDKTIRESADEVWEIICPKEEQNAVSNDIPE